MSVSNKKTNILRKSTQSLEDYMETVTPEMVKKQLEIALSIYRLGNPNITLQQMLKQMNKRDNTIEVTFLKK